MNCPHCKKPIDPSEAAKQLGKAGGKRSRREITPEQQANMQAGRVKRAALIGGRE